MSEEKKKGFFKSLFTDVDFDGDITKVLGFIIVTCGVVGFFLEKPDFLGLIGVGSGLIATGKFSKQG